MRACVLFAAFLLAASCQFDEGGVSAGSGDAAPADAGTAGPDARADANRADAAVPCTDRDGDGFLAVGILGSYCGEDADLDCDDDDARAFPGQGEYYDTPRTHGGYDFDCDGVDEHLDDTKGGECRSEWWNCGGTGWVAGIPDCGGQGSWHVCEDTSDGCVETSSTNTRMACN
ncbi:MAG TPA: hypothetical protein VL172_03885 [Kofleriaceae bacterium]|nr:hypothetical protein [Kofleriaceae bacterium]